MQATNKIHRQKIRQRVRDLAAGKSGHKSSQPFCLAKSVNPVGFKRPLDLRQAVIPSTYED